MEVGKLLKSNYAQKFEKNGKFKYYVDLDETTSETYCNEARKLYGKVEYEVNGINITEYNLDNLKEEV